MKLLFLIDLTSDIDCHFYAYIEVLLLVDYGMVTTCLVSSNVPGHVDGV